MAANLTSVQLQTAFEGLSIVSVVFCSLNALFGIYIVLFALAMWSTFNKKSATNTRLQIITIALYLILGTHYISRAVMFGQRRSLYYSGSEIYRDGFSIPIRFVSAFTTTVAGFIADGLLSWRFYVIFGRAKWALYVPLLAVVVNGMLGVAGDLQHLTFYENTDLYYNHFEHVEFQINSVWGWTMFVTNTLFTGLIIGRIVYVSRNIPSEKVSGMDRSQYSTLVAAIVESALVTWLGLLVYGIATVAPQGHITTNLDVGFVMTCIIPVFFGISQCLMIVRLSLATSEPIYATRFDAGSISDGSGGGEVNVRIQCDVHSSGRSGSAREDSASELNMKLGAQSSEKIAACV